MARNSYRMEPVAIAPKTATIREAAIPPVAKRKGEISPAAQSVEPAKLGEVIRTVLAEAPPSELDTDLDPLDPDPLIDDAGR